MSVPGPMKTTSLTVKNTLNANEAWIESLSIKDKSSNKFVDIYKYINEKIESIRDMEVKLTQMINEFNRAVVEIQTMKNNLDVTSSNLKVSSGVQGPVGPAGPMGPVGPMGQAGKLGLRGLRGPKGESINSISMASDVDIKNLNDGDVLIWNKEAGKWVSKSIFEETAE